MDSGHFNNVCFKQLLTSTMSSAYI